MAICVILHVQQDCLYMFLFCPTWCPVSVCFPVLSSHPTLPPASLLPFTFAELGHTSPDSRSATSLPFQAAPDIELSAAKVCRSCSLPKLC